VARKLVHASTLARIDREPCAGPVLALRTVAGEIAVPIVAEEPKDDTKPEDAP
jgi:hypothetical protein